MEVDKYCVDCKSAYFGCPGLSRDTWFCHHPETMEIRQTDTSILVHGPQPRPTACWQMRKDGQPCGREGKLFQQAKFNNFWQQLKWVFTRPKSIGF